MKHRHWFMVAGACLLGAVAIAGCTAWASRDLPPIRDAAGVSEEDAMKLSLPEQYGLVGGRYQAFNDFVADTQREFYDDEWVTAGSANYFMTLRGNAFTGALNGEGTNANSYYLTTFRRLEDVNNAESRLDALKTSWTQRGWKTSKRESDIDPGNFSVSGTAPDGSRIGLHMMRSGINLTAYSGIYWGDREALAAAIWNIQQNERNEGIDWRPEKVNADGNGLIRPGEYPPYPAWNDVAYEERLEKSPLWDE